MAKVNVDAGYGFQIASCKVEPAQNGFVIEVSFRNPEAPEYNRRYRSATFVCTSLTQATAMVGSIFTDPEAAFSAAK